MKLENINSFIRINQKPLVVEDLLNALVLLLNGFHSFDSGKVGGFYENQRSQHPLFPCLFLRAHL